MVYVCLVNPEDIRPQWCVFFSQILRHFEVVDSTGTFKIWHTKLGSRGSKKRVNRERQDDKNRELDELLTRCKTLQEVWLNGKSEIWNLIWKSTTANFGIPQHHGTLARALAEALCRVREQICGFQRCWDKSIDGKLCNVYFLGGEHLWIFFGGKWWKMQSSLCNYQSWGFQAWLQVQADRIEQFFVSVHQFFCFLRSWRRSTSNCWKVGPCRVCTGQGTAPQWICLRVPPWRCRPRWCVRATLWCVRATRWCVRATRDQETPAWNGWNRPRRWRIRWIIQRWIGRRTNLQTQKRSCRLCRWLISHGRALADAPWYAVPPCTWKNNVFAPVNCDE